MYNVVVIGCGVIGLTSALEIQKVFGSSVKITIYTKDLSPNTTGDVAAGLIEPYLMENTPQDKIAQWSKATIDYVKKLWLEGKSKEAGISLQPIVNLSEDTNFVYPDWLQLTLGHCKLSEEQLIEWQKHYPSGKLTGGFVFVSFTWEAASFLPYLEKKFISNGGEIKSQEIKNFDELSHYDVIVNCTGLCSESLVPDTTLYPIRGQVSRVQAPWQFHTIIVDRPQSTYIIPNINSVILGGTKQVDYNLRVNEYDKERIIEDCCEIVPSLDGVNILSDSVGLRPGRKEVRLELECREINGRKANIIHNYGHGGSGITLSIGCAEEVAKLISKIGNSKLYSSKL